MFFTNNLIQKSTAIFLLFCFIAIRVFAGQTYITSSIERIETSSGTCLSIDKNCSINEYNHNQVQLGEKPLSSLNLSFHLLGNLVSTITGLINLAFLSHSLNSVDKNLRLLVSPSSIFHPPRI